MTKKEKIDQLRQLSRIAYALYNSSYSLSQAIDEGHTEIRERLAKEFASSSTATMKLLAAIVEPAGFTISCEEPNTNMKEFLQAATKEATLAGQNWE